ncbi:MAG: glucose-6-phosphate dehydrogenase [Chloroflexota bacterium]|nr:glucose-6-phosphate dehydrogenase [Chloroflexota bacterium]
MITDHDTEVLAPLRVGMASQPVPPPSILVIFGATGDLTHRKLLPALFDLYCDGKLPEGFTVLGYARRPKSDQEFRVELRDSVRLYARHNPNQGDQWGKFEQGLFYHQAEFTDPYSCHPLAARLDQLDKMRGAQHNRLFYLATAPEFYAPLIMQLGDAKLASQDKGWSRVIVEKPFGTDLMSAHKLNREILSVFDESQVYRIDHYLGKETVQNIFAFRFANTILEPIWNRNYVDHVQITAAEAVGVEGRGGYYETAGALRDMVQSHLLQLVSLTAMEPPVSFDATSVHDEKIKVLRAVSELESNDIDAVAVRGQYGAGKNMAGYRDEPRVAKDSPVETYAALRLTIDNWRWAGVPFYLRTGKHMPHRATEIRIMFKPVPHPLFSQEVASGIEPNVLAMRIQPDEGIHLKFAAKEPGPAIQLRDVRMEFYYKTAFGAVPGEAYETLLLDAMRGDSTLFNRKDEVEAAWSLLMPILDHWQNNPPPDFPNYAAGTWGPPAADDLLARDGRHWHNP